MEKEELLQMIDSLNLQERIELSSIPNLDLYMDQVITLFEDKLGHTKRFEQDKLLTKTMINNYTKDKLLFPAVKKKYTREHIMLMIILYELKQILTISDIKDLFGIVIRNGQVDKKLLEQLYETYLEAIDGNVASFIQEVEQVNAYVEDQFRNIEVEDEAVSKDSLAGMLEVILLTQKANYYKRLAEKIIDEQLKARI